MSMDARIAALVLSVMGCYLTGASYRTQNFIVTADSPAMAREVAHAAESNRRELAKQWLGYELKPWQQPIPIQVQVASHLGAGGVTSFVFEDKVPTQWQMTVQGRWERVLDSVLPHEISHTIFATYFGQPLPRWADEGACTTVEHVSEKKKQHALLLRYLTTNRGIPFNQMLRMKEYPRDIMTLYSQGFSVAQFLIAFRGKRTFVRFLEDAMKDGDWDKAIARYYPFTGASDLQLQWVRWVGDGSPRITPSDNSPAFLATAPSQTPATPREVFTQADDERLVPIGYTGKVAVVENRLPTAAGNSHRGTGWVSRHQSGGSRGATTASFSRVVDRTKDGSEATRVSRPQSLNSSRPVIITDSTGTISRHVTSIQSESTTIPTQLNWMAPARSSSAEMNR